MSSSRWTFAPGIIAAGIVLAGVAFGAAAYFSSEGASPRSASSGPSLEFVPEAAAFVGYIDFDAVAASPLAETWSDTLREEGRFDDLEKIEEATSIDILNDVDSLTLAVGPRTGNPDPWGVAAQGAFDRDRLIEKLSGGKGKVEISTHSGTDIYSIETGTQSTAVAQPDDSILLIGDPVYVREMLDAGAGRKPSAAALVSSWGYGSFEEETFWFAGASPEFLERLVGRRNDAATLRSFALTGRFDTDLLLRARGEAVDAAKARELADVVRGLVAFGRLREESPELGRILESISIDLVDDEIDVSLQVPYDSIRQLLQKKSNEAMAR